MLSPAAFKDAHIVLSLPVFLQHIQVALEAAVAKCNALEEELVATRAQLAAAHDVAAGQGKELTIVSIAEHFWAGGITVCLLQHKNQDSALLASA